MIAVKYRNKTVLLPAGWDELTGKQFLRVIKQLHKPVTSEWAAMDAMMKILTRRNFFRFYSLPADLRWRCYPHFKWVYEKQDVITQLLPKYGRFYGPAGNFENLLMAEFHHTEIAYQQFIYSKSSDINALNLLVAVLYRRGRDKKLYNYKLNSEGDYRVPFNANEIGWNVRRINYWPMHVKLAVFTWYDACRQQLFAEYKEAFTGKQKKGSYAQGLFEMMRSISGGKYGTLKDVEQLPVRLAFLEIIACKREAAELEKAYKKGA